MDSCPLTPACLLVDFQEQKQPERPFSLKLYSLVNWLQSWKLNSISPNIFLVKLWYDLIRKSIIEEIYGLGALSLVTWNHIAIWFPSSTELKPDLLAWCLVISWHNSLVPCPRAHWLLEHMARSLRDFRRFVAIDSCLVKGWEKENGFSFFLDFLEELFLTRLL